MEQKMQKKSIEGLNIWITGASRGIGKAIAEALGGTGARLILSSRTKNSMKSAVKEFEKFSNVLFFPCDVSDLEQTKSVYQKIQMTAGGIDVLINNAGLAFFAPFTEISIEDFERMNDVNYKGTFITMKQVLPKMIENQYGVIINILSVAVREKFLNSSVYSASKAAVHALDMSLREEVRNHGIKIVEIFPGAVETDIWSEKSREKFKGRMMLPVDVAVVVRDVIEQSLDGRFMIEEITLRPQGGDL